MWKLTINVNAETEEMAEDFAVKLSDMAGDMWEKASDGKICMTTALVQLHPELHTAKRADKAGGSDGT